MSSDHDRATTRDDRSADDVVGGVEATLLGPMRRSQVDDRLDDVLTRSVDAGLAEVLFRAGRSDAVYAVGTTDARPC